MNVTALRFATADLSANSFPPFQGIPTRSLSDDIVLLPKAETCPVFFYGDVFGAFSSSANERNIFEMLISTTPDAGIVFCSVWGTGVNLVNESADKNVT